MGNEAPSNPKFVNLWSGKNTTVTGAPIDQDAMMIKTIYDPSPIGYKVPASGAFSGFTTTGVQAFKTSYDQWNCEATNVSELGGANFYTSLGPGYTVNVGAPTIWFPADGMRAGLNARPMSGQAMYYSCNYYRISPLYGPGSPETKTYMNDVSDNSVGTSHASPCNGHSIRPVTDPGFTPWWTNTGSPN